jgi:hypothetical protein
MIPNLLRSSLLRSQNRTFIFLALVLLFFSAACSPTRAPTVMAPTAIVMATAVQLNTAPAVQTNNTVAPAKPTQPATVTPPLPPAQSAAATDAPAPTQNASSQNAPTLPVPTLSSQLSPSVTPLPQLPTRPPTPAPAQTATPAPPQVSREALAGKILFKSTRSGGKYPNNYKWFVMNADGSQVEQVDSARAKELYLSLKGQEGYSPDRSMLVLGERTCASNAHCDLYVGAPEVIMNRSQGQWTPTGQRWYRADNPVWSPRGDWIAFVWNRDNDRTKNIFKGDPYKLNQDFKRLTDFGGRRDTKDPTYSPDGTTLAFATQDGPRWHIWVLNADADNPTDAAAHNLSSADADEWDPLWIK